MCSCQHGYYGPSCWSECPGGGNDPCYGKGTCDSSDGSCTCIEGADQATNCSTCINGWFGDDCTLADTNRDGKFQAS